MSGIPKHFGLSHKEEVRADSYFNLKHQCNSSVALFGSHGPNREAKGSHALYQGTHRIAEAGKDLWRSQSQPLKLKPPNSKRSQPEHVTQDSIHSGFEHLQTLRLHQLCRQPAPVLLHLHHKTLTFQFNLFYFSLCPLHLTSSLNTTEESLALSSLHPPFSYLHTNLLWGKQLRLSASPSVTDGPILYSYSWLSIGFTVVCHVLLVLCCPEPDKTLQM